MQLYFEVEKFEKQRGRGKTKLKIFKVDGNEYELLHELRVIVGNHKKDKITGEPTRTPARPYLMKRLVFLPHWNPPKDTWATEEYGPKEPLTQPGPFNAFGIVMGEIVYYPQDGQKGPYGYSKELKRQLTPYDPWLFGDKMYRIHTTTFGSSYPWSSSHGCIRVPPWNSRLHHFILEYTNHQEEEIEVSPGVMKTVPRMRYTGRKGSIIPFNVEDYIIINVCEKECETKVTPDDLCKTEWKQVFVKKSKPYEKLSGYCKYHLQNPQ